MKKIIIILLIFLFLGTVGVLYYFKHPLFITYTHTQKLDREIVLKSLLLGKKFLLRNQRPEGNFNYAYDFLDPDFNAGNDSPVRQAGALWGLSLINEFEASFQTKVAIEKGIRFFERKSRKITNGSLINYRGGGSGRTGTVALVSLSIIDYMRSANFEAEDKPYYYSLLNNYLTLLISLKTDDNRIHKQYQTNDGKGVGGPSPYFDGETLLALTKAKKYLDYPIPKEKILNMAGAMYKAYVTEARKEDPDSKLTKGFFQWGSMSFYEIYTAGWDDSYAEKTIELSHWMIDVHKTLIRTKNTAYAYEGMISGWELARITDDAWSQKKIGAVIDFGLDKLIRWQVGNPKQNIFLRNNPPKTELALGGVMNERNGPLLRIDVTQHQSHALILALKYFYKE